MTVTYRSVAVFVIATVTVVAVIGYIAFPDSQIVRAATSAIARVLERTGVIATTKNVDISGPQQAHFTNIDGTVRVKRANSNTWTQADYSVPLEKGDVVQTSSEGMAKIVFADGTNYTIKQDSLIVIEENSTNAAQQTQVAVQVTTGTVDLATVTYTQGSRSEVRLAGASAALAPESAAMVHNDPRADKHEIVLKSGSGQVTRNGETVALSSWDKVSFRGNTPMLREKAIGPPILIQPANVSSVYAVVPAKGIDFSWTPVPNTRGYRVRVSKNPYFSSTVFNRIVSGTQVRVMGLKEGGYYWVVASLGANGKESVESERNQFSIVAKAVDSTGLSLELLPFVQHGHVIEVKGKTDPAARVMVNGLDVPVIHSDGTFSFFTAPLPAGESVITVTAQNFKGGVKTEQKRVVIE